MEKLLNELFKLLKNNTFVKTKKKAKMRNYSIIGFLLLLFIFQSCANKKDVLYFQDSEKYKALSTDIPFQRIVVNDILSVSISTTNINAAIPYNTQSTNNAFVNSVDLVRLQGYIVSNEGMIDLPIIGKVLAKGKTFLELEKDIQKLLEDGDHLKNPKVNIRLLNSKFTVIGEVNTPGTFTFIDNNISLLQALGFAGDLTINGKRKDVILIREEDGKKTITHIDLTSTDWFDTPYYYIKQNDVIVVNPNKTKITSSGFINNLTTVVSLATLIIYALILTKN